jgi:C-terminal processing protease CtpA/Prc
MTKMLWVVLALTLQATPARSVQPDAVVDALVPMLSERYMDEALAGRMAAALTERRRRGDYSGVTTPEALATRLTTELQAISHDKHLRVFAEPRRPPQAPNGGVGKVELLEGNVGLIEVTSFAQPVDMFEPAFAAAMATVAKASALIIDLRENRGGRPDTAAMLVGYLLDSPSVLLATVQSRLPAVTREVRTPVSIVGPRFGATRPVYVLIGASTFSAAEACAFDLQSLKRVTIVGEVSGGGANPGGQLPLPDGMAVFMPTGHVLNAVTHTNWEGVGVKPDIATPAADALTAARRAASSRPTTGR